MKKLFLLMAAGLVATGADAQERGIKVKTDVKTPTIKTATDGVPVQRVLASQKTTQGGSRWYNAAESLAERVPLPASGPGSIYSSDLLTTSYLWQDSSVRWPAPDNAIGITFQSIAQTFHPQSSLFNDVSFPENVGKIAIRNEPWIIDSIAIMGRYQRLASSPSSVVDTLLVSVVWETAQKNFSPVWFTSGNTAINHGIDTADALYYLSASYQTNPVYIVAYQSGGLSLADSVFKFPLTEAVFADSSASGWHDIVVPIKLNMLGGKRLAASVTYKSGAPYTAGTEITSYNHFRFVSHETDVDGFVQYPANDRNISYVATKDTTGDLSGQNNVFVLYYPVIGYGNTWGLEMHNIAFLATCPTCYPTDVKNVPNVIASAEAYPNPANTEVKVPVTVSVATNVQVTLLNAVGQVVATSNLGKVAAGQTSTATFATENLPAGLYMYTVKADGQTSTGKVVVAH